MSQQSLQTILKKVRVALCKAEQGELEYVSLLLSCGRERGFETFLNRKKIWPFLLQINADSLSSSIYEWEGELDKNSPDYQQLQKDAERSLASMKTFQNITKFHLQKKQRDVLKILDSFFAKNKGLRYIQGFHDVASIFLVLFGNNTGYYMMEKAGKTYFKDFLTKDIGALGTIISDLVLELLAKKDRDFEQIFECFKQVRFITFIIPWILTWFAHVFTSVKTICRIWDYLLCTGTHGIIYLTAGIILATKHELVAYCEEFDQASIHTFYQEKAKNESIDIEQAISRAIGLQQQIQIESLLAFQHLDADSVFLSDNIERMIDMHRKVKEYNKVKAQKDAKVKKIVWGTIGVGILMGVLFYLRQSKRILH